ncbi:cytochrome P450 family protein [Winogradskya humida]|uniref:Cytochrome P450 hydroxylase n=1 Tax=Winogradskya humida TaxID=113566 RepID=A0ABQ4A0X3_9ACTN|nr:cytochrome P450 [Actinoplanes humidus]GIE24505.1 cytochrome P450 hydroxylase [Actinoplanes humidus]
MPENGPGADSAETLVPPEVFTEPGDDPHTGFAALRAAGPVHRIDYPAGAESYVVVDYAHVERAFGDPRLSKRLEHTPDWFREKAVSSSPVLASHMLLADPPEHTRLRKLVSRAFLPRRLEQLRPRVQQFTDELVDALPESGEVDLIAALALPLPLMVICDFLGVPYQDWPQFHKWGHVLSRSPAQDDAGLRERRIVNDEVAAYLAKTIATRRDDLREDLISDLIRAADDDGMFTDEELVSTIVFLIIAGHKTTANLIGNGTALLLRHPGQLDRLRADPALITPAIEEFLRFEGSTDRATFRIAVEDMDIGGSRVPRGSFVHLSIAAADRDPAAFPDPDRFDIARSPNRHMAFGHGPHFCAGAPLARLEGQVAFSTMLRRLPEIDLTIPPEDLDWVADSSISRGLVRLPVRIRRRLR